MQVVYVAAYTMKIDAGEISMSDVYEMMHAGLEEREYPRTSYRSQHL